MTRSDLGLSTVREDKMLVCLGLEARELNPHQILVMYRFGHSTVS